LRYVFTYSLDELAMIIQRRERRDPETCAKI
jgi:hypothetical protein